MGYYLLLTTFPTKQNFWNSGIEQSSLIYCNLMARTRRIINVHGIPGFCLDPIQSFKCSYVTDLPLKSIVCQNVGIIVVDNAW